MTVREAFKAIADAIRKRDNLDETVTFKPADMPNAIENIGAGAKAVTNQVLLEGLMNRTIEVLDFGTISSIPDGACINIGAKKVSGKSVLSIGAHGFYYDSNIVANEKVLTKFDFPNVISYGAYAFANNTQLTGTFGKRVEQIGEHCFDGDIALELNNLPESIVELGEYAFSGCSAITVTALPPEIKELPPYCFDSCKSIPAINFGDKITSIGEGCFQYCTSVKELSLPGSLETIGEYAFRGCSSLTTVNYAEGLQTIGGHTFDECTSYAGDVVFPNSLRTINEYAFFGTGGITSITFGTGLRSLAGSSFSSMANLSQVSFNCLSITSGMIDKHSPFDEDPKLTKAINVPYGSSLFQGQNALQEVTIADGVASIAPHEFDACSALIKVTIPESITSIGDDSFYKATSLQSIEFPKNLTDIGENAFNNCTKLSEIDLTGIKTLHQGCFYMCTALTEVTVPNDVTTVGTSLFEGCNGLTKITWNSSAPINSYTFSHCYNLKTAIINGKCKNIYSYAFFNNGKLETVKFPETLESIGQYAFAECDLLNFNYFPDVLNSVSSLAFANCTGLTSIRFHSKVNFVPNNNDYCFEGCTNLKDIYVPWKEGEVNGAPWGAVNATIHYEASYPAVRLKSFGTIKKSTNGKQALSSTLAPQLLGVDEDGYETISMPEDVNASWSISESEYATINASTGEVTFTNAPAGTEVTVTATSEKYGISSGTIVIVSHAYTINLNNGQWVDSGIKIGNNTVYESNAGSYHINNGQSLATITLSGYSKFVVYIRSYAEGSYDYTQVFPLDVAATRGGTSVQTTSNKQSATQYYKAEYTIPDSNEHTIQILYSKDGSNDNSDDRGYFYVAEEECE